MSTVLDGVSCPDCGATTGQKLLADTGMAARVLCTLPGCEAVYEVTWDQPKAACDHVDTGRVRKYDGGRRSSLCEQCRTIVGAEEGSGA